MDSRLKLLILLIAGVAVALGFIMMRGRESQPVVLQDKVEQAAPQSRILVTTRDIDAGDFIQAATDLEWKELSQEDVQDSYLIDGNVRLEEYQGAVARRILRAGAPLRSDSMLRAGEGGFMSAVLSPGMRAVSIAVNPISGNAGFVSPGDQVDLVLTHRVVPIQDGAQESIISETFIRDVRVLAVDQIIENPENKPILARTVTVEVSPAQVQQISVATEMGKVSLALRSIAKHEQTPSDKPADISPTIVDLYDNYTGQTDVSRALDADKTGKPVRIIRANEITEMEMR